MNARVERFNRTLREGSVAGDEDLVGTELPRFNRRRRGYPGWRRRERPRHRAWFQAEALASRFALVVNVECISRLLSA